jgi:hypothetical protein
VQATVGRTGVQVGPLPGQFTDSIQNLGLVHGLRIPGGPGRNK